MPLASNIAPLIVALQQAIDAPYWAAEGPRNNPDAEANGEHGRVTTTDEVLTNPPAPAL